MQQPQGTVERICNDATKKLLAFYKTYDDEFRERETQPPDAIPAPHPLPMKCSISRLQARRNAQQASSSSSSSPLSQSAEVRRYLNISWVNMTEQDFDILQWWKSHESTFPILARFARDILAVPVFTVSSESAFSSCGRILDNRRMSLKSDMVEMITLAKDLDQAARRLQENVANAAKLADYFDNLYINDPLQNKSFHLLIFNFVIMFIYYNKSFHFISLFNF